MKSMLIEASTITKAIEKAWDEAGCPSEFTIKILEKGEINFFGFTKKPAIISIAFDPKKVTIHAVNKSHEQQKVQSQKPKQQEHKPHVVKQRLETFSRPDERRFVKKPDPMVKPLRKQQPSFNFWSSEFVDDIKAMVKEAISILGVESPFATQAEKKVLTINFEKAVLKESDDERQLFASLSYLFMQMLKKKHKKKLQGYHLVLSSKEHDTAKKPKPSFNR